MTHINTASPAAIRSTGGSAHNTNLPTVHVHDGVIYFGHPARRMTRSSFRQLSPMPLLNENGEIVDVRLLGHVRVFFAGCDGFCTGFRETGKLDRLLHVRHLICETPTGLARALVFATPSHNFHTHAAVNEHHDALLSPKVLLETGLNELASERPIPALEGQDAAYYDYEENQRKAATLSTRRRARLELLLTTLRETRENQKALDHVVLDSHTTLWNRILDVPQFIL